jgi:large subunit ribosomal protein L18Ae
MVKVDPSLGMKLKQFIVAGRRLPSDTDKNPTIYRMRIFAPDELKAKSRFWFFVKRQNRLKRAHGEIVSVKEVHEKNTHYVKTYGLTIRYESRTGIQIMYREYRETSVVGAVGRMYQDMAGKHSARNNNLYVISAKPLHKSEQVKRPQPTFFYDSKIRFPVFHAVPRVADKSFAKTFAPSRPSTRNLV